jgi:alpha-galactosidase
MKNFVIVIFLFMLFPRANHAQVKSSDGILLAKTPPMGWMTWNFFADNITEQDVREMADAMVSSGMITAGYMYIVIDDGWQGGRDNKNNIIPDPNRSRIMCTVRG